MGGAVGCGKKGDDDICSSSSRVFGDPKIKKIQNYIHLIHGCALNYRQSGVIYSARSKYVLYMNSFIHKLHYMMYQETRTTYSSSGVGIHFVSLSIEKFRRHFPRLGIVIDVQRPSQDLHECPLLDVEFR